MKVPIYKPRRAVAAYNGCVPLLGVTLSKSIASIGAPGNDCLYLLGCQYQRLEFLKIRCAVACDLKSVSTRRLTN